ncbi:MAG: molybdopterin-dependent oxidoreductase [Luteitalea sp.]|nr:molybdopterin-dependent oxidoreductase [Luteitalea sp.]
MTFTRRDVLGWFALLPFAHVGDEPIAFVDYEPGFRVDVQPAGPRVKSFDLRTLTGWQTPVEDFFTFHHTKPAVDVDLSQWRLEVSGSVARPRTFTYADLSGFAARQVAATIECSGNTGHPRIMNGLVSNAVWTGPALAPLLRECGVLPEAREVVFFGADIEREQKWAVGDRELAAPHGRSIFIEDALEGGAILAMHVNGQPLPPDHGHPLRVILPGWYGMTQVKWLNRIVVLDRRYEGRHMARNYHSIRNAPGGLVMETSISRNKLKSVVARVRRIGASCRISGAAWGGRNAIERVEVRIDAQPWQNAEIVRRSDPRAWSLWTFDWTGATPGPHTVVSRAVDSRGRVQPERSEFISAREDNAQWPRKITVGRSPKRVGVFERSW